ncbi:putative integrase [Candidatus Glomeribacter gigasporarum BEG34]|uniref:Putative integrase n=1 Tax=Candidatus Glomeribacter gigasporarum BEG34 TaxID=1070319 RepID=G2JB30_9BURK|nr:tyrosine-type recombinase/integrase [Candidatus Glomeribacter gigasporarum]CCD29982.1 putative integrase [Candidatus Glomeribacter gigasporarum BEG34]
MGRKRKTNELGLPERVYAKHGAFYYVHRAGHWERLGTDLAEVKRKANLYNDPHSTFGAMAHYLDAFVVHCEARVKHGEMAPRTYEDYKGNIEPLKDFFGKMVPASIEPKHIAQYLDMGVALNRPVRANREKACLSSCFTWLIRCGEAGVKTNPCSGVRRNREAKRERYVAHEEFAAVYALAVKPVQILMDLIYRTLQRPEDIIRWTRANIVTKCEGSITRHVLRNTQRKTGAIVDIEMTPEIDAILQLAFSDIDSEVVTTLHAPFVHRRDGRPYVYSGLTSMLQRYLVKAGISPFGFYDLKSKGATDMWQAGVPLERIQALCGHESVTTTEIYVKRRWHATITPNQVEMASNKNGAS